MLAGRDAIGMLGHVGRLRQAAFFKLLRARATQPNERVCIALDGCTLRAILGKLLEKCRVPD